MATRMQTIQTAKPAQASGADKPAPSGVGLFDGRKNIRCLTSIRFFPALLVLFYHGRDYFTCWQGHGEQFIFAQAVAFFFILSGFVLTLNYFNLDGKKGALSFYLARLARIWPAHLFTLVLLIALVPEVFKLKWSTTHLFATNVVMLHSWVPSWRYFFSFNAPSWSNSTELLFYLTFPLAILLARKRWYLPLLIAGLSAAAMVGISGTMRLPEFDPVKLSVQGLVYIHPLTRVFEFAVGMMAALLFYKVSARLSMKTGPGTVLELVALAFVAFLACGSKQWRVESMDWAGNAGSLWLQNSGIPLLGFVILIFVFALERGLISRVLSAPFLVMLGELSFGLYMLHCVVLAHRAVNYPQVQGALECAWFVFTMILMTHLMWFAVERPLRRVILNIGNRFIDRGKKPPKLVSHPWSAKTAALVALEAVALAGAIYIGLPTLERAGPAEAAALTARGAGSAVVFAPYAQCLSASATTPDARTVRVNMVWSSLRRQSADTAVKMAVFDASGAELGHFRYTQDPRHTTVEAGTVWKERADVPLKRTGVPATVVISLLNSHSRPVFAAPAAEPGKLLPSLTVAVGRD